MERFASEFEEKLPMSWSKALSSLDPHTTTVKELDEKIFQHQVNKVTLLYFEYSLKYKQIASMSALQKKNWDPINLPALVYPSLSTINPDVETIYWKVTHTFLYRYVFITNNNFFVCMTVGCVLWGP